MKVTDFTKIASQDSSPNNGHQGDMPYYNVFVQKKCFSIIYMLEFYL